ncbi:UDP-N-acetylmuramate dehydrogenase [Candidatus Sumerlaeota bacterium]|nr:UDP-N-acetylmuramate dehydrogenase [Candidatus Sumerlaeota bacterium]MBI3735500.1 UDP-N-acetylmuramate dehydrogenase [Candidatus Sumerlaeota bacterium]
MPDLILKPLVPAEELETKLNSIPGVSLKSGEPLSAHTSMGVGGPATLFVEAEDRDALVKTLGLLKSSRVRWMMLGGGSNTLFDDAGYDGVVVHLGKGFRAIRAGDAPNEIFAGAAASLSGIMNFAKRNGLGGAEFCAGIPGVLGGALAGNAGAGGLDICSITESVEVIDAGGNFVTRRRGEFKFSYRMSQLREDVILGAALKLTPDSPENIEARIQQHLSKRFEQPLGERSSGCMFKNPPGNFAGRLIDQSGLKGLRIGNVFVSDVHANFMINEGKGSAADIRRLMDEVRARVLDQTGVELETEVRIIPFAARPS